MSRDKLLFDLEDTANSWMAEYKYLTGEDDSSLDKSVGQAYKQCADELTFILKKHIKKEPNATT